MEEIMTNPESEAEELREQLPDDMDVTVDEITEQIDELHTDYAVTMEEAVRTVQRNLREEYDGELDGGSGTSSAQDQDVTIEELGVEHDEEWVNVRGTVQELFELSDAQANWMHQKGLIGDDTGTTTIVIPDDVVAENPDAELEVGETVEFDGVVGDEYQGNVGLQATTATTFERLATSYSPPENDTEITGAIIAVQSKSGLIRRCSHDDCTHVVEQSNRDGKVRCPDHNLVEEPENDMRLKTIIDDGQESHQVFFDKEKTEALTGITMEEAEQMAADAKNIRAAENEMRPLLIGRHYRIAGNEVGEYVIVNQFEQVERDWEMEGQRLIDSLAALENEVAS